jgi:ABC-type transport system involved in Fe-S cluster assembly fused permease/ATPase subunit
MIAACADEADTTEGARVKKNLMRLAGLREFLELFKSVATPFVRRRLAGSLIIALAVSSFVSAGPLALKWIVDSIAAPSPPAIQFLLLLAGVYVVTQWLNRILGSVQAYVQAQADRRVYRMLSDRLFDHVIRLPLKYHLGRRTGAVNETLTNGLMGYQMVQQVLLMSIIPVVVQLCAVSAVLVSLGQGTILVLFCCSVLGYGAAFAYGSIQGNQAARQVSAGQIEARALMTDSILNYETVKYFTAEAVIRARLDEALLQSEGHWMRYFSKRAWNTVLVASVFTVFLGATTAYSVIEVAAGRMTTGTFVLVNAYLLQLVGPIETIGAATQTLAQGFAFLEKMVELFRERAEPPSSEDAAPLNGPGKLTFDNVSVGYSADRPTLRDVSFELAAGKTLGIVGASGAGKSTLVRLLTRLMDPDSGRILIDDVPVGDSGIASVRAAIAVVPQDTVLFNDTIAYNISFGRPGCTQAEIEEAATLAELHEFITKLPDGYRTRVGERGVRLSGGEKQRVSIARAALKCPKIFVFDEATSSLDSRTERDILTNLRRLAAHSTTLVIAHRLSTVVHADRIIVLHGGAVVEHGTHEELLRSGGRYADLWSAQQQQVAPERAVAG